MTKMSVRRPNCSIYNPCGRNGHCDDDGLDQWTCSCKFWWSGSTCDHLTNSGVQVIILGCLLGILIGMYYGLSFRRSIKRKRMKTTNNKTKFLIDFRFQLQRSTYLFIFIVLIIALCALLIKWSIIQPIHDHIVERYRQNRSLYFDPNSICQIMNNERFNFVMFPISIFVILLLTIESKRKSFKMFRCDGHFAPPVPVDFFNDKNRTLVTVIFAMSAHELLIIANNTLNGSISTDNGIVLTYLNQILQVLVMGFRYYPILSSVHLDSLSSLVLGTIYVYLEFPFVIIEQTLCQPKFYSNEKTNETSLTKNLIDFYGTGRLLVVIELLVDLPRYLCLSYTSVRLSEKLYEKFRNRLTIVEKSNDFLRFIENDSIEMFYLRNLCRTKNKNERKSQFYQWRNDFQYSTRVLCVYSSIFLFLYVFLLQGCVQLLPFVVHLEKLFEIVENNFSIVPSFLLAVAVGTLIVVVQLFSLLSSIRRNLFQVYRGDDSEIPRRNKSNFIENAIGNFHFAGYLIGYVLWGLVLIVFFFFILFFLISLLFVFKPIRSIELILKYSIPILLFVYFKKFLNKSLARFTFLQHHGEVLAMNNRRFLMIFLYFNFFLDAFLGLFSSILRLVQGVVGGVFYMCRLDYSPLGRKLETWDDGFNAYCGFIHTECTHRHPLLLIFVAQLISQCEKTKKRNFSITNPLIVADVLPMENRLKTNRYVRKWQLAAFLIRNPSIVFFRKAFFNEFHLVEHRPI